MTIATFCAPVSCKLSFVHWLLCNTTHQIIHVIFKYMFLNSFPNTVLSSLTNARINLLTMRLYCTFSDRRKNIHIQTHVHNVKYIRVDSMNNPTAHVQRVTRHSVYCLLTYMLKCFKLN